MVPMRSWSPFLLLIPLAGCQDNRVTTLEKRVDRLEQTVHQLEADKTKTVDDDVARRAKLESCVADANAAFQTDMVSNGTRQRNGSYNVSVPVLEQMERRKQTKVEECRLLYSK
jgi:NADP-dependent 3-hydroxy acid dehydrogenase YdfG